MLLHTLKELFCAGWPEELCNERYIWSRAKFLLRLLYLKWEVTGHITWLWISGLTRYFNNTFSTDWFSDEKPRHLPYKTNKKILNFSAQGMGTSKSYQVAPDLPRLPPATDLAKKHLIRNGWPIGQFWRWFRVRGNFCNLKVPYRHTVFCFNFFIMSDSSESKLQQTELC